MAKPSLTPIDLVTLGRVSMDLFSLNIGAPFTQIRSFSAHVGGSPTNIAIGASRLGLRVLALTAVGDDEVGRFVLNYLAREGVETTFISEKPARRTGLAVLGIEPPDRFPLVFYRENPADIHFDTGDVLAAPIAHARALLLSGTALSRGLCREATLLAAQRAREAGTITYLDLDLRPDQWLHPRAYGLHVRRLLPLIDVVIGTEEEVLAALSEKPDAIMQGRTVPVARSMELARCVSMLMETPKGPQALVMKRGRLGATVFTSRGTEIEAAPFPVTVLNTVGAGDAFASGLIYGRFQGWGWHKSARMGNACGALVVTRHGCAEAMPYLSEVLDWVTGAGGF